jgi:hypothetical protein
LQWEQEREELKETMKSKVNEMRNISSIFDGICDRLDAALSRGLLDTFTAVMEELILMKQMPPTIPATGVASENDEPDDAFTRCCNNLPSLWQQQLCAPRANEAAGALLKLSHDIEDRENGEGERPRKRSVIMTDSSEDDEKVPLPACSIVSPPNPSAL